MHLTSLSFIEIAQNEDTAGRIGEGLKEGVEHFGRGGGNSGSFCMSSFTFAY